MAVIFRRKSKLHFLWRAKRNYTDGITRFKHLQIVSRVGHEKTLRENFHSPTSLFYSFLVTFTTGGRNRGGRLDFVALFADTSAGHGIREK